MISCQNYETIMGFALNTRKLTKKPEDATVLLCEGCHVHVLAVDHNFKIDNVTGAIGRKEHQFGGYNYHGKTMTVIHLFHSF